MGMVSINASPLAEFFHVGQYKQIELSNIGIHLIDQKSSSLKIPFESVIVSPTKCLIVCKF